MMTYILVAVVVIWLLLRLLRTGASGVGRISGADFQSTIAAQSRAVILDVRTPREFASGHMKGAVNLDIQGADFSAAIVKLDPAKTYFVYCRSGARSGAAVAMMRQKGFTNIYELAGGASAAPQLMTER